MRGASARKRTPRPSKGPNERPNRRVLVPIRNRRTCGGTVGCLPTYARPYAVASQMIQDETVVVQMGNYCEALLKHDCFNALYDEFRMERVGLMLGSEPHETKKREAIYAEMNALGQFLTLMKTYVDQRNKIIEATETASIADEGDDD